MSLLSGEPPGGFTFWSDFKNTSKARVVVEPRQQCSRFNRVRASLLLQLAGRELIGQQSGVERPLAERAHCPLSFILALLIVQRWEERRLRMPHRLARDR